MIAKLVVCAAALLLAPAPAGQQKPAEAGKPQIEQPKAIEKTSTLELLPIEENIVKFTNAERVRQGLQPLEVDPSLMTSARRHASWMAQNRNMVHTRQPVAENIAMGQPNSGAAVNDWMNSSGHRANILNQGHRRIGVAAYRTVSGTIYWCQQFLR